MSPSSDHGLNPALAIHRPYLSTSTLNQLSGDQAIASANQLHTLIASYLKDMSVPAKYVELMMSVPKDKVWPISHEEFDSDLNGFIPELKDWVAAKCDKRTDIEKAVVQSLESKRSAGLLFTEQDKKLEILLSTKQSQIWRCEQYEQLNLSIEAWHEVFANKSDPFAGFDKPQRFPRAKCSRSASISVWL
jgi:hypothetical protein